MAAARDLSQKHHNVVAVIGDGAMSAGMAYEAMNNAGSMESRLIVILNDNDMSISPPVGALSTHLNRMRHSAPHESSSATAVHAGNSGWSLSLSKSSAWKSGGGLCILSPKH